jgi:cytochrome bd ubiquinol oxidase subunit II
MLGFIWFWLVAVMIVAYVVLDGFDLGVGVLHLFLARNQAERQATLLSIGPVWDGNEVWLLAAGGTLYFAFPLLYASAFSGFYLPLMIVLWLLILRGVSLELRNHLEMGVWRTLLDGIFGLASALLAIFFGAALANVLRGVPLQADGFFFLPLWTNFRPGESPGILDWYTVIGGLVALVALTLHGALWLAMKTSGELEQRARRIVTPLWLLLMALTVFSLIATMTVRPSSLENYYAYPFTFVVPVGVIASALGIWFLNKNGKSVKAFLCSCFYLFFMLAGACWGLYPTLLPATTGADHDITLNRALSGQHTLQIGLVWWLFGMTLAVCYVVFVYSRFRGKADLGTTGH